ncbi:MAG: aminoacyl-tRNA hydrolase [Alphaproteobacteria bacterium]|nr:aminoacyl-tRNA hydrolase [Alphaproteobacteria bacterium]
MSVRIQVTSSLSIPPSEFEEDFIRASGPGGQNVNKVATAVQLRFDVGASRSLTEAVRQRLLALAGHRVNALGVLVITAQRFRTLARNREDARERLAELIRQALVAPKTRRATRVPHRERARRLSDKARRSSVKGMRGKISDRD